jgi:hypothetical protein
MELHERSRPLRLAEISFSLYWTEVSIQDKSGVETYEDGNYVISQLDAFWINATRKDMTVPEALAAWKALDTSSLELGEAIKKAGDFLASNVVEHELTHAEINRILVNVRSFDAKYLLRSERYPDEADDESEDSDEPGEPD